jgi:putative peptidoglycan lipid II flippase
MTASVLVSRILGYVRDAVVASQHGATAITDVYFASFTLPDLMSYMLAGGALYITFLPMFSKYLHSNDEDAGWACFSVIATTMGTILAVLTIIIWLAVPWLLPPILPGFSEAQIAQTVSLTRIVLPAQLFFYLGGLMGATVLARERFLEAALAPIVYNLLIITGGLALGPWLGIAGFSWGALAGAVLGPFGLMLYAAKKRGLHFTPRWSLSDPDLRRFVVLSLPVMVGFSLVSVDEWVARYFASSMEPGAISWIQNARRLMLVPVAVLGQAAGQATLPFLSRLHAEGKTEEAGNVLSDALRVVIFATLAASIWMAVTSDAIVGLFFERGAFTATDTIASASALVLFSVGIVAWAVQAMVTRGFYAIQDTWTPMLLSSIVSVLAVAVYWYLGQVMGFQGLALATSIGMGFTALVTVLALRGRMALQLNALTLSFGRSLLVTSLAGAAAWWALSLLPAQGYFVRLLVGSAVFGAVLASLATGLKLPEWQVFVIRIRARHKAD